MKVSSCCKADYIVAHGCDSDSGHGGKPCDCKDGTQWFECTRCKMPCTEIEATPFGWSLKTIAHFDLFGYRFNIEKLIKPLFTADDVSDFFKSTKSADIKVGQINHGTK